WRARNSFLALGHLPTCSRIVQRGTETIRLLCGHVGALLACLHVRRAGCLRERRLVIGLRFAELLVGRLRERSCDFPRAFVAALLRAPFRKLGCEAFERALALCQ